MKVFFYHPVTGERLVGSVNKRTIPPTIVDPNGENICMLFNGLLNDLPRLAVVPKVTSSRLQLIIESVEECEADQDLVLQNPSDKGDFFVISPGAKRTSVTAAGALLIKRFGADPKIGSTISGEVEGDETLEWLCWDANYLMLGKTDRVMGLEGTPDFNSYHDNPDRWRAHVWRLIANLRKANQ